MNPPTVESVVAEILALDAEALDAYLRTMWRVQDGMIVGWAEHPRTCWCHGCRLHEALYARLRAISKDPNMQCVRSRTDPHAAHDAALDRARKVLREMVDLWYASGTGHAGAVARAERVLEENQ